MPASTLLGYANPAATAKRTIWLLKARDAQLPPSDDGWRAWWSRSGRGTGKTRTCAEWCVDKARTYPGTRWHYIAPTQGDLRLTSFEGESGLLAVLDESELKGGSRSSGYNITEHVITLSNGSMIIGFSAEKPARLRGPQCHGMVLEEISSWNNAQEAMDMAEFGCRLPMPDGSPTQYLISSTPKRNAITRELAKDPDIHITTESTYANSENLDPMFLRRMLRKYEGTRLGKQELHGEILEDAEGAMWSSDWIIPLHVEASTLAEAMGNPSSPVANLIAARVGWDPAITSKDGSDLHGIVAMGRLSAQLVVEYLPDSDVVDFTAMLNRRHRIREGDMCVLADRSANLTPVQAARRCIALALEIGSPEVVIEKNQGGDTWDSVWAMAGGPASGVRLTKENASQSKEIRATPLAAKYEEAHRLGDAADVRIFHLHLTSPARDEFGYTALGRENTGGDSLDDLESEITEWVPAESPKSPNRLDALVWAAWGLGIRAARGGIHRAGRLSEVV